MPQPRRLPAPPTASRVLAVPIRALVPVPPQRKVKRAGEQAAVEAVLAGMPYDQIDYYETSTPPEMYVTGGNSTAIMAALQAAGYDASMPNDYQVLITSPTVRRKPRRRWQRGDVVRDEQGVVFAVKDVKPNAIVAQNVADQSEWVIDNAEASTFTLAKRARRALPSDIGAGDLIKSPEGEIFEILTVNDDGSFDVRNTDNGSEWTFEQTDLADYTPTDLTWDEEQANRRRPTKRRRMVRYVSREAQIWLERATSGHYNKNIQEPVSAMAQQFYGITLDSVRDELVAAGYLTESDQLTELGLAAGGADLSTVERRRSAKRLDPLVYAPGLMDATGGSLTDYGDRLNLGINPDAFTVADYMSAKGFVTTTPMQLYHVDLDVLATHNYVQENTDVPPKIVPAGSVLEYDEMNYQVPGDQRVIVTDVEGDSLVASWYNLQNYSTPIRSRRLALRAPKRQFDPKQPILPAQGDEVLLPPASPTYTALGGNVDGRTKGSQRAIVTHVVSVNQKPNDFWARTNQGKMVRFTISDIQKVKVVKRREQRPTPRLHSRTK